MNHAEDIPAVRFAELRDGTRVPVSTVQTTLLLLGGMRDVKPSMVTAALALAWDEPISKAARAYLEDQRIIQDGVMHESVRNVVRNAFDIVNPVVKVHEGKNDDDRECSGGS